MATKPLGTNPLRTLRAAVERGTTPAPAPAPRGATRKALRAFLAHHPGWEHADGALGRTFAFDTYMDGIAFVVRLGAAAEARDHHPEIVVRWRKVRVAWSTHDAGGITGVDVEMAEQTEALAYADKEAATPLSSSPRPTSATPAREHAIGEALVQALRARWIEGKIEHAGPETIALMAYLPHSSGGVPASYRGPIEGAQKVMEIVKGLPRLGLVQFKNRMRDAFPVTGWFSYVGSDGVLDEEAWRAHLASLGPLWVPPAAR